LGLSLFHPETNNMKTLSRTLTSMALLLCATACADDLTQPQALWKGVDEQFTAQVGKLAGSAAELKARLGALPANTPGKDQAVAALAGVGPAVDAFKGAVEKAKLSVAQAMESKKLAVVTAAIEQAKAALDEAAGKAAAALDAAGKAVAAAKAKADELTAAAAAAVAAEKAAFDKAAKEGGSLDFSDIDFEAGSDKFSFARPESQQALDKLLAWAKSCPGLKFELVGHTSREGDAKVNQKLSEKRAAAVKAWLVGKGVEAKAIVKTSGLGAGKQLVAEPAPGSAEEKAMDPAKLAEARNKNRRIEVAVKQHCK
jgi:OOP family OmpA-OmpF porin